MTAVRKRRPWYLRPIPVLSVLAILFFVPWFAFGRMGTWDSYKLNRKKQAQAEQIRLLELRKERLQNYLTALKKNDPLALERAAREQDFVGPGEMIYEIRVEKTNP